MNPLDDIAKSLKDVERTIESIRQDSIKKPEPTTETQQDYKSPISYSIK